jgi:hypothetical protein
MENAIGFFEKASKEATHYNPAKFCLPFYHSFYSLTFKKEEAEVQRYLSEAKSAVEGSKSKEKLLEAVENLGNALKEVQKVQDFDSLKSNLNAYRRFCDHTRALLDTTEEKAPGASRLIRKGLPIIDETIKKIILEIQVKTTSFYEHTKETPLEELGEKVNNSGRTLSTIGDVEGLKKAVNNLQIDLKSICSKLPENEKHRAYELVRKVDVEQFIADKFKIIATVLNQISAMAS